MHVTHARARYAETDTGGVVYHSNYLVWFEVGRTDMLRDFGCSYAELERSEDVVLPVTEASLRYVKSARYDDLVRIETRVGDVKRVRFRLDTRILNDATGELLCEGHLWLASVRRSDGRLIPLPGVLAEALGAARAATESDAAG